MNIDNYLRKPNNCPFCNSKELNAGQTDFDDVVAYRNITCSDCGKEWTEEFSLSGVTEFVK